MTYRILCRVGLIEEAEELKKIGGELSKEVLSSQESIVVHGKDADAVIVGATEPYTEKVIRALKRCKIISRMGIGCDNIDLDVATEEGIPVAYVPDASVEEVSDHTIGLVIALARRTLAIREATKKGLWQHGREELLELKRRIPRLSEQTLGLAGLGRIGSAVCRKARALGMRVVVFDPYVDASAAKVLDAEIVSFDRLLGEADFVSLHLPLTEATKHLLTSNEFNKMKPGAFLINTARGGLVKEDDLAAALSRGIIAGAGLDVTDPEPPDPKNPLLNLDQVITTGHTAFYSKGSMRELRDECVGAVVCALTGGIPEKIVNPAVLRRENLRLGKRD